MEELLAIAHGGNVFTLNAYLHVTGLTVNSTTVDGETALFLAIRRKDEQAVQTLTSAGADVNHKNAQGDTPLMVAACLGAVNMLRILKLACCSLDESNAKGQTALMLACFGRHATFVQALIDLGASVNKADIFSMTAIMLASQREGRLEYLNILLAAGADVNATNNDGHTPLMLASREGALRCMKRLISHGVNINTTDENGMSASMLAAKEGHPDCLRELIFAGCDTNVRDKYGNTTLILATMYAKLECVKLLKTLWGTDVNAQNNEGMTALMLATPHSDHAILHQLLVAGAYKDVQNSEGQTALMISVEKGMYKSFCSLLQAGASIDVTNQDGQIPLMLAAADRDTRYVWTLMQTIKARSQFPGDYISKRDKRGNTALMIATQRGRTANLEILIRLGVEFNKINKAELPLIVASLAGHANCTRLLVKNRARFLKDGGGDKVLVKAVVSDIVKALIGAEENVYLRDKLGRTYLDQSDQQGNTALMTVLASHALDFHGLSRSHCIKDDSILFCEIASEFRNRKLQWLQLLINAGAELNKVNQEGKSAIMLAAESKEDAAGEYLSLLLAHGGNVNLHDNKGETALMKASCAGNVKQVRTLLQFGADLHLHDQRGRTALMHIAVFNPLVHSVPLLGRSRNLHVELQIHILLNFWGYK